MNSSEEEEENMEEVMDEEMMDEMDEMSEEQDENMDDMMDDMQNEEDEDTPVQNEEVIINYTDSGYSPAEVTVSSGTKVVFKNGSSSLMWTASNPHPVHTDLSSFDAKSGASAGGTYSFTFEEFGTFQYHNHAKPAHGGKVIVE